MKDIRRLFGYSRIASLVMLAILLLYVIAPIREGLQKIMKWCAKRKPIPTDRGKY